MSQQWQTGDRCQWETQKKKGKQIEFEMHRGAVDCVRGDTAFVKEIGKNMIVKVPVAELRRP